MPWAMDRQMGAIRAVVAVLDIKLVMTQQRMNTTKVSSSGEGLAPSRPMTASAIILPAPDLSRASARDRVPPKRKMVFMSMDLMASFSEMTPVRISRMAPTQPEMASFTPICSSKIMASNVSTRITRERIFFHLGTLLKSFCSSKTESSSFTSWLGSSLWPMVA